MTTLSYTYSYETDETPKRCILGIDCIEVEIEAVAAPMSYSGDPVVDVHHVYAGALGGADSYSRIDLLQMAGKDKWLWDLGVKIASAAEEDADIKQAVFAEAGSWEGVGPSERFVWDKGVMA